MLRRVRIAASVFFAAVAVALCVLWVRTQTAWDTIAIRCSDARGVRLRSISGTLSLEFKQQDGIVVRGRPFRDGDVWKWQAGRAVGSWTGTSRFRYSTAGFYVELPYWLLVAWTAILAGLPWLRTTPRSSFSLREMFLAVTLVAAVLGLVAWLASRMAAGPNTGVELCSASGSRNC